MMMIPLKIAAKGNMLGKMIMLRVCASVFHYDNFREQQFLWVMSVPQTLHTFGLEVAILFKLVLTGVLI